MKSILHRQRFHIPGSYLIVLRSRNQIIIYNRYFTPQSPLATTIYDLQQQVHVLLLTMMRTNSLVPGITKIVPDFQNTVQLNQCKCTRSSLVSLPLGDNMSVKRTSISSQVGRFSHSFRLRQVIVVQQGLKPVDLTTELQDPQPTSHLLLLGITIHDYHVLVRSNSELPNGLH